MHPSTEDLLTIRDGEPVDVRVRAAVNASPAHQRELERLAQLTLMLQALPELDAPAGVWQRVVAAERKPRFGATARAVAGVGIAAAVATVAIIYVARSPSLSVSVATAPTTVVARPSADGETPAAPVNPASYVALVEESARLEKLLAEVPAQRPLMTGGTASTIVGLEDRIAFIDEQLTYGTARGLQLLQREALWSERVELKNALVHVRFAQAQWSGF
jgi:hypothetical protein